MSRESGRRRIARQPRASEDDPATRDVPRGTGPEAASEVEPRARPVRRRRTRPSRPAIDRRRPMHDPKQRDPVQVPRPETHLPRTARSRHGMVATSHPSAMRAGQEMLESGGNAFDAAVATALALCVCEPAANGLGGQSMVLFHHAKSGRTVALDGSSRAPNRALPGVVTGDRLRYGHACTTVPSTPAVLGDLLERYGSLPRHEVLAPAIRLAQHGYKITPFQHAMLVKKLDVLRAGTAAPFFLKEGQEPYQPGETFRQPVLAATLRRLESVGWEDFYTGRIARSICRDMAAHNGLLTEQDLAQVPWPIERRPDRGRFHRHDVATFPPAGAGRVLLQVLEVTEHLPRHLRDLDSPAGAVAFARNVHQALMDHLGEPRDPALHTQLPQRMGGRRRDRVLAERLARRMPTGETSHTSVMDDQGNAVGITQSIEEFYGSCTVTPELGFLYNNYLGAFDQEDPGHPYHLRPNAVPWSSVAPTLLFKRGRPKLIIGSPGSQRIAGAVAQAMIRMREGQDPWDAVRAPRLHATPDGHVHLEAARMEPAVLEALQKDGWDLVPRNPYSLFLGSVHLVQRRGRHFTGASDPRRDGCAGGPE